MSWETESRCEVPIDNLNRLLPRFFDPLEDFTAPEYYELARSLLEMYRCYQTSGLGYPRREGIDITLLILNKLIELAAKSVIERYRNNRYRKKLEENLATLSESEVKMLNKYLQQGIQITGLNLTSLIPFLSDKLFMQYFGLILKISAIMVVGVKKYWAKRTIRKFSVNVERLARKVAEELGRYGYNSEIHASITAVNDIVGSATSLRGLTKLTEELYRDQVYANTPEVIAFARELQELRKELLEAK